jgi:hypothetical protein
MQLLSQFAPHPLHTLFALLRRPEFYTVLVAGACGLASSWWKRWRRGAKARRARHWPAYPAVIDVVSVAARKNREKKQVYPAVLTYFYRHPELQSGEYEREFTLQEAAVRWAAQFKGHTVMVHVNPANAADSVLFDADLEGVTATTAASAEAAVQQEATPQLSHSTLLIASVGEIVSVAGLAISLVMLGVTAARGSRETHHGGMGSDPFSLLEPLATQWTTWVGLALLAAAGVLALLVRARAKSDDPQGSFWRSYQHWSPAWTRWLVQGFGGLVSIPWLLDVFRAQLPGLTGEAMKHLGPYLPYLVAAWFFLALAAFHGAVLRSQEQSRSLIESI